MRTSDLILIVDDEQSVLNSLKSILEYSGYQVVGATNGAEALESCARISPDLILLDINMPEMDGFQVCERLKADPSTKDIPILFVSGVLDTEEKLRAFSVGGVDYITKPFEIREIRIRIQTHIELRKQKRELENQHTELQKALFDTGVMNRKLIAMNERLRESEGLKSQFIAHMRNEINDPLSAILGLAEEIARPEIPLETARKLAETIKDEAFALDYRMRNIFCAAELEAGETSHSISLVDVGSILRNTVDSFLHFAQLKSIHLGIADIPETGGLLFESDGSKLRIIATNLIANAIEFNREGGNVEVRAFLDDGNLLLQVEDNGIGIHHEDKALIFERFRQLDTGLTRNHRGQGLGLSVVKALVDFMGGWISVESEPGRGSTFTCTIPKQAMNEDVDTSSFDGNLFFFGDGKED